LTQSGAFAAGKVEELAIVYFWHKADMPVASVDVYFLTPDRAPTNRKSASGYLSQNSGRSLTAK